MFDMVVVELSVEVVAVGLTVVVEVSVELAMVRLDSVVLCGLVLVVDIRRCQTTVISSPTQVTDSYVMFVGARPIIVMRPFVEIIGNLPLPLKLLVPCSTSTNCP
jgi:hypothetical protein